MGHSSIVFVEHRLCAGTPALLEVTLSSPIYRGKPRDMKAVTLGCTAVSTVN